MTIPPRRHHQRFLAEEKGPISLREENFQRILHRAARLHRHARKKRKKKAFLKPKKNFKVSTRTQPRKKDALKQRKKKEVLDMPKRGKDRRPSQLTIAVETCFLYKKKKGKKKKNIH